MLTENKVQAYFRFLGMSEYSYAGQKELHSDDWAVLDRLRMALANVKAGNTSDAFVRDTLEELNRQTDGPETARLLMDRS